ncbi:MAG: sensor histidine kinase [Steroidobacteraceae bacterium]
MDVCALVGREAIPFVAAASRKGLALTVRADGDLPQVLSDERRIGQVVTNLLSNAVKFTDTGRVSVRVAITGPDRIGIFVEDTGVGIPGTELQKIFEPFVRVPRPGGRLRDGAGLGLALCRNVARVLGGDVEVTSELGRGSRFTFWLPARRVVAA